MHHIFHRGTAVTVVLLRILTACAFARAESSAADTMRLAGFEGDARIEDASGQPRFAMKRPVWQRPAA